MPKHFLSICHTSQLKGDFVPNFGVWGIVAMGVVTSQHPENFQGTGTHV